MSRKVQIGLIIAACFFAVLMPVYIISVSDVNREVDGCERLNTVRTQLYSTLGIAIDLVDSNDELVQQYQNQQTRLVTSVEEYADESTANSVDVDCKEAYPKPFPINEFD